MISLLKIVLKIVQFLLVLILLPFEVLALGITIIFSAAAALVAVLAVVAPLAFLVVLVGLFL